MCHPQIKHTKWVIQTTSFHSNTGAMILGNVSPLRVSKKTPKNKFLLIELWPLSELRRLSTEPPAFSLGFSKESVSGRGDCGEPGAPSGLD